MTQTRREDPHSPQNLITEDYEYLFAIDTRTPWALDLDSKFLAELINYEPATMARGTSQCHHCGAWIRYAAFLRYLPTGRTIVVGETCLDNRFARASADFHRLRKQAELDRKAQRIKAARQAFVDANPDLADLNDPAAFSILPDHITNNSFIADIGRKLRQYGELSEAQITAVRRAIARETEKAERRAAEAAAENWIRVPSEGRQIVTGTVLTERWDENAYGPVHKMLLKVQTPEGDWKLWTTMPRSMGNEVERGDIVTINVTVTRSDQDQFFAFGKRPVEVTS
jgi:hypothetical protein